MTRTEQPFSLILPSDPVCKTLYAEKENKVQSTCEVLRSGMILLRNYLSLSEQVEIVNICEELGIGPGGFGQPGYEDGRKLQLQMLCLGRYWDPQTRYSKGYGFKVPQIPDKFISLVETALEDSQSFIKSEEDQLPWMSPNIGIVNFYTATGRLGIHQDRDESWDSINKGSPVVSISNGDSAEFLYGDERNKLDEVVLKSGDILIFGGKKSRNIYHGVKAIIPNSAPEALLKASMLRPGRLNLTFRQY
ncbi:Oxoglutarate/iron-dependent dioxygenase [Artemisia annua]|uniref:Oxoglutarate/iron-dependent dioxygenase n=1 Tax=Artemisia annua TaxID=35608 RepID=A0A2U1PMD5_ARTAN|nr:Oxoglutarate/iron-dependent dioxygenase [Artemisia annua]